MKFEQLNEAEWKLLYRAFDIRTPSCQVCDIVFHGVGCFLPPIKTSELFEVGIECPDVIILCGSLVCLSKYISELKTEVQV